MRVVAARVEVTDRGAMRQMVDDLRAKLGSGVIVLGSVSDGKVSLIAAVTKDLTNRLDAGKIVKQAAAYRRRQRRRAKGPGGSGRQEPRKTRRIDSGCAGDRRDDAWVMLLTGPWRAIPSRGVSTFLEGLFRLGSFFVSPQLADGRAHVGC